MDVLKHVSRGPRKKFELPRANSGELWRLCVWKALSCGVVGQQW
jgi:hypothetical protein